MDTGTCATLRRDDDTEVIDLPVGTLGLFSTLIQGILEIVGNLVPAVLEVHRTRDFAPSPVVGVIDVLAAELGFDVALVEPFGIIHPEPPGEYSVLRIHVDRQRIDAARPLLDAEVGDGAGDEFIHRSKDLFTAIQVLRSAEARPVVAGTTVEPSVEIVASVEFCPIHDSYLVEGDLQSLAGEVFLVTGFVVAGIVLGA